MAEQKAPWIQALQHTSKLVKLILKKKIKSLEIIQKQPNEAFIQENLLKLCKNIEGLWFLSHDHSFLILSPSPPLCVGVNKKMRLPLSLVHIQQLPYLTWRRRPPTFLIPSNSELKS